MVINSLIYLLDIKNFYVFFYKFWLNYHMLLPTKLHVRWSIFIADYLKKGQHIFTGFSSDNCCPIAVTLTKTFLYKLWYSWEHCEFAHNVPKKISLEATVNKKSIICFFFKPLPLYKFFFIWTYRETQKKISCMQEFRTGFFLYHKKKSNEDLKKY